MIADMIEAAERAIRYVTGVTQDDLVSDSMRTDAILRVLGIMGEAVTRLSDKTQSRFTTVPWAKMKAMRNLLVHRYDRVDAAIVWETVTVSVPAALLELRAIEHQLSTEQLPPPVENP
ncbi:MAG: DUF86 domain-containing protein [Gemmataceae bacterium]|nr:DUF86 domain-containing protein [Gemmataceae bacterium]